MSECPLCRTEVDAEAEAEVESRGMAIWDADGQQKAVHPECMLRMALGGIGHLTDHAYWCGERKDPDMGLSFRESALAVDQWVRRLEASNG